MSRSKRYNPAHGMTTARSEKAWKRQEHQRERHQVRQALREGRDDADPLLNETRLFGNPWSAPKDGKQHAFDVSSRERAQDPWWAWKGLMK